MNPGLELSTNIVFSCLPLSFSYHIFSFFSSLIPFCVSHIHRSLIYLLNQSAYTLDSYFLESLVAVLFTFLNKSLKSFTPFLDYHMASTNLSRMYTTIVTCALVKLKYSHLSDQDLTQLGSLPNPELCLPSGGSRAFFPSESFSH